jgi:hypothetical protein
MARNGYLIFDSDTHVDPDMDYKIVEDNPGRFYGI